MVNSAALRIFYFVSRWPGCPHGTRISPEALDSGG